MVIMEMKEYLKELERCPDEKLRSYHRIFDNYPINLKADINEVKEILEKSKEFEFVKSTYGDTQCFNYKPGIMYAQLSPRVWAQMGWKDYEQIIKDFNMSISLHPYQKKDMEDITYQQAQKFDSKESRTAVLRSVKDLSKILMENKVHFCLPYSHNPYPDNLDKNYYNVNYAEMAKFIPKVN